MLNISRPSSPLSLLAPLLISLSVGCETGAGSSRAKFSGPDSATSDYAMDMARVYQGSACENVIADPSTITGEDSYRLNINHYKRDVPDMSDPVVRAHQVLLGACDRAGLTRDGKEIVAHQTLSKATWLMRDHHLAFRPRAIDHLSIASALIWTAHPGRADYLSNSKKYVSIEASALKDHSYHHATRYARTLGIFYASLLDQGTLKRELDALTLPDAAKEAFVANTLQSIERLKIAVASEEFSDEERVLLLELPQRLWAAHLESSQSYASILSRLVDLEARRASILDEPLASKVLLTDYLTLRDDFVEACGREAACMSEPIYHEITASIAPLYAMMKHKPGLSGIYLVTFKNGRMHNFAQQLNFAQLQLGKPMEMRWMQRRDAVKKGMSEDEARALHPGSVVASAPWFEDKRLEAQVNYLKVLGSPYAWEVQGAIVDRITKKEGDQVELTFKDKKQRVPEDYDCKSTNRINRVTSDGRVIYEEVCKERWVTHVSKPHRPIVLFDTQAALVRRDDIVSGYAFGSDGWIDTVTRKDTTIVRQGHAINEGDTLTPYITRVLGTE